MPKLVEFDIYNYQSRKRAAFMTLLYIIGLVLLLFWMKLDKPIEQEESLGLVVDFGYSNLGYGVVEPSAKDPNQEVAIPAPGNPPFTQEVKEKVLVQDQEESQKIDAVVPDKKQTVVVVENVLKTPVKAEKKSTNPNQNVTEAEPTKKVDDKAMFKGFKGNGTGDGSQGNTKGDGNMGDESGSKSDNYLGKSTGLGSEGEGRGRIGTGLLGRKLNSIPGITDNSNKTGKIIIKVKVGSDGKVISSEFSAQGSTMTDSDLIHKCETSAKKAKFTPSDDKDVDYGTLIFTFQIR